MIKIVSAFFLIFFLLGCKSTSMLPDYLNQPYPDSIPVVFAPDVVSIEGRLEHGISFTPDTRELAFGVLNKDDFTGEIYYSKKTKEKWTEPSVFESLKNKSVYLPYFSPNGKNILYTQSKSDVDILNTDIWLLKKAKDEWTSPQLLNAPINSLNREANASMTNDGTIYFSSNRNCEGKENCHSADLFYSKLKENEYQSVEAISKFLSSNDEESVFISPNEDYIIFCRYQDNKSGVDLYISYRDVNGNWIDPQPIDCSINSKDWERRPFISADNKFLFFTRLQIEESGLTESDIYWVNTSKLFKPFVYHSISDITLQVGKKFEISFPNDYFKDIDDNQLTYIINHNPLKWLSFDKSKLILSGIPPAEGTFEITISAMDKALNSTNDSVLISVKR